MINTSSTIPQNRLISGVRVNSKMPSKIPNITNDILTHQQITPEFSSRLYQTEQSNRSLLEELIKLQNEYKHFVSRTNQSLDEERQARRNLEHVNHNLQIRMNEMEEQTRRCDVGLRETKQVLAELVNHTKSVEKAVTTSHQDLLSKKEQSLLKVQELKKEVIHQVHAKEQSERILYSLRDELHELHSKVEAQNLQIVQLQTSLGLQKQIAEELAKRGLKPSHQDPTQIEAKVIELNHLCVELQRQIDHESKTRELAENSTSNRIADLTSLVTDQNRKREEMLRVLEIRHRDLNTINESDRHQLSRHLQQTIDVIGNDAFQRETRLKYEVNERFDNLEKQLANYRQSKLEERNTRDELERKINSNRKSLEDDLTALHNKLEMDVKDIDVKLRELFKATNLLDQQVEQVRDHSDHLIGRENRNRSVSEKEINRKIDEIQDRLKTGLASVTDAITALRTKPNSASTHQKVDLLKVHEISQDKADDVRKSLEQNLTILDNKVKNVDDKLMKYQQNETQRLSQIANDGRNYIDPEVKPKLESLMFQQERVKRQMEEIQNEINRVPREISDLDTRVERLEKNKGSAAGKYNKSMQTQMERTQTGLRKLAESVQTSNKRLNEKITEETTKLKRQIANTKYDLDRLNSEFDTLIRG